MIKVVTIAREYGSGGAELGRLLATKLGWELLDRQLVDRVAHVAGLDRRAAEELDERARRWWQWAISGLAQGTNNVYSVPNVPCTVDQDFVHDVTMRLIQRAADQGRCVIVGRGGQCFLQGRTDAFHVLAYAPSDDRLRRLRTRQPGCSDLQALIRQMDGQRAKYVRDYYRRDWLDKSLYNLCINTAIGLNAAAEVILTAIRLSDEANKL